jgi:hypothetical protein
MYVDSINGSVVNITSFGHVSSSRNVYSTRSDLLFGLLQRCAEQKIASGLRHRHPPDSGPAGPCPGIGCRGTSSAA